MTRPETCGAAGGAMALWVKFVKLGGDPTLITSRSNQGVGSTGFRLRRSTDDIA